MLSTVDLIAAAKAAHRIPTNAALARLLQVPEKYVQRWGNGKHTPDDLNAAKLAELAGLDPAEVVAWISAERAASQPARELWQRIAARLHATAAAGLVAITFTGGPDAGAAVRTDQAPTNGAGSVYYVNSVVEDES